MDEILFDIKENYNPELFKPLRNKKYNGIEIMKFTEEIEEMKELHDIHKIIKLSKKII